MAITKTQAIKEFLMAKSPPDLAKLYGFDMECQVLVAQDKGERVEGEHHGHRWQGYSDGDQTWKNFRIPLHANTVPEYKDGMMRFSLADHADGIGMTGWDWTHRKSRWVAFDFDAITGHSEKHEQKLTDAQLKDVQDTACKIPWVTVRRSTSGNGLHLYVFLPGVDTANHTEHMALARAILSKMSAIAGFDFDSKVDNCGSNIWVWHRKYARSNGMGLKLVKQGEVLTDIPLNWRDHVKVAAGAARKNKPGFIPEAGVMTFEELCGQHPKVQIDSEHRGLMEYLDKIGALWWFDTDHHMLVAHTHDLKAAHQTLHMRGVFDTSSQGREHGADQNCFAYPMRRGAWAVRRHTPGVQEHESWDQDASGWTRCYLNRDPDIKIASRAQGGNEMEKGGFYFQHATKAVEAAKALGASTELPDSIKSVAAVLKPHKDGRLILEIDAPAEPKTSASDFDKQTYTRLAADLTGKGWVNEKGKWKLVFGVKSDRQEEQEIGNYDDLIRHLVTESGLGENCGWVVKSDGIWINEPLEHVRVVLTAQGVNPKDIGLVIGSSVMKKWTLVNRPFAPEYPGDRTWNRGAAQLAYVPSSDIDNLKFDTWRSILNHCGSGLDDAVKTDDWCKANMIHTGGDYLFAWVASLIKNPLQPLPYLFFYGPQGSGKSIFHEALRLLMTTGCIRADAALISQSGFNAELENAVLCIIEETDLRANKSQAYNRIKDWVTSLTLSIHRKGKTPYMTPNSTHWIQCGNDGEYCPVFPGDTRITMCYVGLINEPVPKDELIERLKKEASDFLAAILQYEIPKSNDRLFVRVIETDDKKLAQECNLSDLERYISENCHYVPGAYIKFSEFHDKFVEQVSANRVSYWSKIRLGKELPVKHPRGRLMRFSGQHFVGNISWEPPDPTAPPLPRLIAQNDELIPEET
jgi:hypothetical protein